MKFEWNVSNSAIVGDVSSSGCDPSPWSCSNGSADGGSLGGKLLVGRMGRGYASERALAARGALYAEGNDHAANWFGVGGVVGERGGLCGSGCGLGACGESCGHHREGAIDTV